MNLTRFALILAVASMVGCSTETTATSKYPPTSPSHVRVLRRNPKTAYETLGTVRDVETYIPKDGNASVLSGSLNLSSPILEVLRRDAAKLGADAIILTQAQVSDPMDTTGATGESSKMWLAGVAIRFTDAAPTAPPPSGPGTP